FLIGVGMLIDYRVFFSSFDTIIVAIVMIVTATLAKFLAAWITQKSLKFSVDERNIIFGLSNSQAAATLAAVLVGYNIILNKAEIDSAALSGVIIEPVRLLNDSILNGTILMILFTCTIASFVTQKGAQNIALSEMAENTEEDDERTQEKILVPVNNAENAEELINLALIIKSKNNRTGLFALTIIDNQTTNSKEEKEAKKILKKAIVTASATDNHLTDLLRYDLNIANGITSVVKENKITDIILGLTSQKGISKNFLGNLTEGILAKTNVTTLIYKPSQPLSTIKRHLVFVPEKAEREIGFPFWLIKIWNIARNTGSKIVFYCDKQTIEIIRDIRKKHPISCEYVEFNDWDNFLILSRDIKDDDNLIIIMSRKDRLSYHNYMVKMPVYLNKYFIKTNFILVFPVQSGRDEFTNNDLHNQTAMNSIARLDDIGKSILNIFRKK
ncbi:MAG: universal stress protein, partial [Candidatus Methanofastidiosa archaeon]|nr:universal stress protein [Candidatus Methanofastidiosa archaeon]